MGFFRKVIKLLLVCLPSLGFSQKIDFQLFSISKGLPQNLVYSVAQDSRGFIWVNSGYNLSRFDGDKFVSHLNSNHPVFSRNRTAFVEMQTDGDFLVYCVIGAIEFTNTLTGEETSLSLQGKLPAGYNLMSGHCKKLMSGELVAIFQNESKSSIAVLWLKNGKITHFTELNGVNSGVNNFSFTIVGDRQGNLYVLNKNLKSVLKFNRNGTLITSIPTISNLADFLCRLIPGRNNSILLVAGKSVFRLEEGASDFKPHPANPLFENSGAHIFDLYEMPNGNLWLACHDRHLFFYNAQQSKILDYHESISSLIQNQTPLSGMYFDRSGAIWVNSNNGLLRVVINPILFDTYFTELKPICNGFCSFRGFT